MTQNEIPGWAQGISGKHAVVTGGSKGLGRAICIALAQAGARVTAVARDPVALQDFAKEYPSIKMWQADVNEPAFGVELAQRRVDIFVNNAGTNNPMLMVDVPVAVLDQMLNLHE